MPAQNEKNETPDAPVAPVFAFEDVAAGRGGGTSEYVQPDMLNALLEVLQPGGPAKVLPGVTFDTGGKAASAADRWRIAIGKRLNLSADGRGTTGVHAGRIKREDGLFGVRVWRDATGS